MTHNQVAYFQANNAYAQQLEVARHNKEQERLTGEQVAVAKLQAIAQTQATAEAARHNRAMEYLNDQQLQVQRAYNAGQLALANANLLLAQKDTATRSLAQIETARSNKARESETYRSNVTRELETSRQNTWTNILGVGKIVAGIGQALGVALLTKKSTKSKGGTTYNYYY